MGNEHLLKELRIDRSQRTHNPHLFPRWAWAAGALAVLALAAYAVTGWTRGQPVAVQTTTAAPPSAVNNAAVLQATGYVTARRQATVSAQVTGTLTKVLIEEGDHVQAGQLLARLDDSSQHAYLDSAKAAANAAQARIAQLRTQLAQARRNAERTQDLASRKLVAAQDAEQARTQVESLLAELQVAQAQAQSAMAQVAVAQVNYDRTEVRAPFNGVITQKAAQVGEIVSPSAAGGGYTRSGIGTIVDMDSLEIDVDVNQAYIGRVQADMPAEATLDAYPDWKIPAHVIAIVPTADRAKATVKVRIGMDVKDARIVPDMGVRVSFLESANDRADDQPSQGILVPASALTRRNGKSVLFSLDEGVARLHPATTITATGGKLRLVQANIAAGSTVIDSPSEAIVDGTPVARMPQ